MCNKLILQLIIFTSFGHAFGQQNFTNKVDGYKAIWFELNQKYEYGDKYSGALGTYTAKHTPLAIYAPKVDKTFFVYGGTKSEKERHLLCMIGVYDHISGIAAKPAVVYDKLGVDDPHDNPSILIDNDGFIWVFVSGRGTKRPGYKFKSKVPYSTEKFVQITEEEMTYPQPHHTENGMIHFFTKYSGVRQLYYETSEDGLHWTDDKMLAAIPENEGEKSGHYQTSGSYNSRISGTFFNRHPQGNVDKRTDLYYTQTADFGQTWTTVDGIELTTPITDLESASKAVDYASLNKNVYLKDMGFDAYGNPICLHIRSNGHEPGPLNAPYEWCVTKWNGTEWETHVVTNSDHNYDMGSIYISGDNWKVIGPTEEGPQAWGVGGEVAIWQSNDQGVTWKKEKIITTNSKMSHSYVRRPLNFKAPFCFFWADGHSHEFSKSELYFGNLNGDVWKLPYDMKDDFEKPIKVK